MANVPAGLGLDIPNFLPESVFGTRVDWLQPAGRLIWSTLLTLGGIAIVFVWSRRPKRPEPVTWAAAMAGAVGVFALMILGYGVVPHEWLTFANSYLNWGKDAFFLRRNSVVPFDITMSVLADTIEVLIYGVLAVVNVALFVLWQKRPVREPEAEDTEAARERATKGTSAYGRPVTTTG